MHDEIEPLRLPARKRNICAAAGRCLCSGTGLSLFRLRNSFMRVLKHYFPGNSALRAELCDWRIFARFQGYRAAATNAWARKFALRDGLEVNEVNTALWFHTSHMTWSPVEPVFLQMLEAGESTVPDDFSLQA